MLNYGDVGGHLRYSQKALYLYRRRDRTAATVRRVLGGGFTSLGSRSYFPHSVPFLFAATESFPTKPLITCSNRPSFALVQFVYWLVSAGSVALIGEPEWREYVERDTRVEKV